MPRAKRSKQYRKLMEQFSMGWGFHEPYQVLVDADFITEANKCKMDLVRRLEDTLHGQVKPMITQCSMRHLYGRKSEPGVQAAIEQAKTHFERRRCGHHPDEYPEPLSALECLHSVVDPKDNAANKHRYVCAINDDTVRSNLRQVAGTPLVYIRRSVMIMEPMATVSAKIRSKDEKSKFRAELKTPGGKRKREDDEDSDEEDEEKTLTVAPGTDQSEKKKKKKPYGRKEPNPLAVKKKKSKPTSDGQGPKLPKAKEAGAATEEAGETEGTKRKRRRKHKSTGVSTNGENAAEAQAVDTEN
ncbi:rRNA-processing protein UTP23 [Hypoxylon cercidicola]|nr:rRNA-processing protein UTP23 [Hypoxylon cercidicola]